MVYKKIEVNKYIKNYELRPFSKSDLENLVDLFKEVFKKEWNINYWKWFLYQNPYNTYSLSLWDKDKLIGFNCALKKIFSINGDIFDSILVSTALVDPNYRRRGIYSYIVKKLYNCLSRQGYLLIYGFPNENYNCELYNKQRLNWDFCSPKQILIKKLKGSLKNRNRSKSKSIEIKRVKKFSKEINFVSNSKKNGNFFVKYFEYLNWRYIEHPKNDYYCFLIKDDHIMLGYFILKTYINESNQKYGEIDDFLFIWDKYEFYTIIYNFIYDFFKDQKNDYISIWVGENNPFFKFLIQNGFSKHYMITSWGFKLLNNPGREIKNYLINSDNWDLKMGDSDVF